MARAATAHAELVLDFLAYLELERGLSRNTLEAYRSDLLQLGEFLARRGTGPLQAGHADLAAWVDELAAGAGGRPPAASTTLLRSTRTGELGGQLMAKRSVCTVSPALAWTMRCL